jgi:hypothetical protein
MGGGTYFAGLLQISEHRRKLAKIEEEKKKMKKEKKKTELAKIKEEFQEFLTLLKTEKKQGYKEGWAQEVSRKQHTVLWKE